MDSFSIFCYQTKEHAQGLKPAVVQAEDAKAKPWLT
jgi:hypothetical protein